MRRVRFWKLAFFYVIAKIIADRDEAEMREQLEKLKQQEPAPPMPSVPSIDVESSTSPSSTKRRFAPRFVRANSGRGRGAAAVSRARVTPRVRKKGSHGCSQASSGGTRTKRARPSFKPPTRDRGSKVGRAAPSLNPILFPV